MFDIPRRQLYIEDTDDPRLEHRGVTLWLQYIPPTAAYPVSKCGGSDASIDVWNRNRQFDLRSLLASCACGTYVDLAQKEGRIADLEKIRFGGKTWPRVNLLGLRELRRMNLLPEGDAGEPYCLEVQVGDRGTVCAVFSDSVGAARRWWDAWMKQSGCVETVKDWNWSEDKLKTLQDFDAP